MKNFTRIILLSTLFIIYKNDGYTQGNTPQTITMGAGTSNSAAFSTQGTIGTDGAATFYVHWDATYLYLGWSGGRTNYSSDMYYAAIDTDPNGTNGGTNAIEGVSFVSAANTRKPDYFVVYENNSSFYGGPVSEGNAFEIFNVNAGNWNFISRTGGNDNTSSKVNFQDAGGEVRLRISWTTLGFTPGNTTPLAITMWTNNSSGNFMWSRFPTENPTTGSTPKTLAYSFLFYNTSSGVNPSTAKVIESNTFTTSSFSGTQTLGLTISGNVSISGSTTLNSNLNILSGSTLNLNNNDLTVNTITGSGTLTGSASSNLTLAGAAGTLNFTQASSSTRSLNNLSLNSGASATLGNALDVYGTIALTSATLDLNAQNLTLKSNASGTARIANLTGSTLSGATNVTMERWIPQRGGSPTGGRAYRLLAPTVNTAGTLKANWMEGGMNTAIGTNVDPKPTYGTHVTGTGGNSNGFDVTQSNASSLYFASNGNINSLTYTAAGSTIAGTNIATMNALTGYFLYIRGDRSVSLQVPLGTNMPTTSTTLHTTGSLITGPVSSFTNAYTGGGAHNLVTNPYPSPISWSLVKAASSNVTDFYTLWDPNVGARGGFVTVSTAGVVSGGGTATINIQPGQAFFVESNGGVPAVNIAEGHKVAGNNNTIFLVPPESFQTALYFIEDSGYRRMADGVNVVYDNAYSASVNAEDAKEMANWDENIAINRESIRLAIESRPVIQNRDTIPLFMNNMKQRAYEFDFIPASFSNIGLKAELVDNFLNTRTLLSVVDTSTVHFSVTADPASSASDRFMIVFSPLGPLAIDQLSIRAQAKYQPTAQGGKGVQVDWTAKTEKDMDRYEVERSFNGSLFVKINTIAAMGNSTVPVNYSWMDANPQTGDNFYRVKAIDLAGLVKYTSVVKVNFGKANPAISVSPNPVSGNSFSMQLTDVEKGIYSLVIYNKLAQPVYRISVQHGGGSANITITPGTLAQGSYELVLTGDKNTRIVNRIIKN